jgi:predicted transposase YdaD
MKTDSIFYQIFQSFPEIFFQLIDTDTTQSSSYEFSSVELKQTAFRIDGLFLPNKKSSELPIYFVEIQFQRDPEIYARFFSEIFLYLRLYNKNKKWHGVLIFPKRSLEPKNTISYQLLLESHHITRLYLDELGEIADIPLGLSLIKLIVENKKRTPNLIRSLINKTKAEISNSHHRQKVLDLIETIVLYKLPFMSREELAAMYTFTKDDLRKTRYYQDVRQEAREELAEEVRESIKQEVRESMQQEVRESVKQEVRESVQQEVRESVKQEVRESVQQEVRESMQQEVRESVQQETSKEEALKLVQRLIRRRLGAIAPEFDLQVNQLETIQLENLAEALLDIQTSSDLSSWLENPIIQEV